MSASSHTDAAGDRAVRRDAAASWCLRLADGPLSSEDQTAFDAWLAEDPLNAAVFDDAVGLWQGVESQAAEPDMIVLRGAALESLRRANRLRWTRAPRLRALAVAAAVVAAFGLGVWRYTAPQVYETGIGERRVVSLSDGSKLSLDADTEVRVRYTHGRRDLTLEQGRARFQVAKDALRPFTVRADGRMIVATGTQFSVERLGGQVRVILYEGKVAVLAAPAGGGRPEPVRVGPGRIPAEQVLKPGGELVLAATGKPTAVPAVLEPADLGRSLAWEGGQLVFSDEPLARAIERVNRYADHPLVLGDAAAGQVLVNGVFTTGDTPAFVEGVTAAYPLEARESGDRTVISYDPSTDR